MKTIISIFIIQSLAFQTSLLSQSEMNNSLSAHIGGGMGFLNFSNTNLALNFSTSIDYKFGKNAINFSYVKSHEFALISKSVEYISSYQIKYGRVYNFKMKGLFLPIPILPYLDLDKEFNYSIIGKIGVSYNDGLLETGGYNSPTINKLGFGLPIELELKEEITNYFGLGFIIYYNLNKVKNIGGINTFVFFALK